MQIIQVRFVSALKELDDQVGVDYTDHLPEVLTIGYGTT